MEDDKLSIGENILVRRPCTNLEFGGDVNLEIGVQLSAVSKTKSQIVPDDEVPTTLLKEVDNITSLSRIAEQRTEEVIKFLCNSLKDLDLRNPSKETDLVDILKYIKYIDDTLTPLGALRLAEEELKMSISNYFSQTMSEICSCDSDSKYDMLKESMKFLLYHQENMEILKLPKYLGKEYTEVFADALNPSIDLQLKSLIENLVQQTKHGDLDLTTSRCIKLMKVYGYLNCLKNYNRNHLPFSRYNDPFALSQFHAWFGDDLMSLGLEQINNKIIGNIDKTFNEVTIESDVVKPLEQCLKEVATLADVLEWPDQLIMFRKIAITIHACSEYLTNKVTDYTREKLTSVKIDIKVIRIILQGSKMLDSIKMFLEKAKLWISVRLGNATSIETTEVMESSINFVQDEINKLLNLFWDAVSSKIHSSVDKILDTRQIDSMVKHNIYQQYVLYLNYVLWVMGSNSLIPEAPKQLWTTVLESMITHIPKSARCIMQRNKFKWMKKILKATLELPERLGFDFSACDLKSEKFSLVKKKLNWALLKSKL